MKYLKIAAKIYVFAFTFMYAFFIIFKLPIRFLNEPNELTFVLAILLLISALTFLATIKPNNDI